MQYSTAITAASRTPLRRRKTPQVIAPRITIAFEPAHPPAMIAQNYSGFVRHSFSGLSFNEKWEGHHGRFLRLNLVDGARTAIEGAKDDAELEALAAPAWPAE